MRRPVAPTLAAAAALLIAAAVPPQQPRSDGGAAQSPPVFVPMPIPRTLVEERGDARIVVDGALQDWPSGPPLLLDDPRQISGTAVGAWRGATDLAGRVFLLWDEADLFVAAVVRDDWHRPLDENTPRLIEIPPADSVVLWLDPARDTRSLGPDPGRREDVAFWLADVEGQGRKVVLWDCLRGTARFAEDAAAAVTRDQQRGLTTYEARIAWREILPAAVKPRRGLAIDLQVVINDYDEITDLMPQTRVGWTFGMGPAIDPGLLGTVLLSGQLEPGVVDLPPFPDPPELEGDPVPGRAYWIDLQRRLCATEPVAVARDSEDPRIVLGAARLAVLEELEGAVAAFPRIDHLEYHQRVHRDMPRECRGIADVGLPFFWHHFVADLGERARAAPPERGFRIFALPAGGWLVCSAGATFAIDPAGGDLERHVSAQLDFVLLTSPLDITRRNDQVLLRLSQSKRPFYTHIALHLPGIDAQQIPLVKIGETYTTAGLKIRVLGLTAGGRVTPTAGYVVEWPDGTALVHAAESTDAAIAHALSNGRAADLLVLPVTHPGAAELGRAAGARMTLLDGPFRAAARPGGEGRVPLADAFAMQTALRPNASIIVAPGESIDIAPHD